MNKNHYGWTSFNIAMVGFGLSSSAISLNMQQVLLFTFLLTMLMMLLSGLLTPVQNMPEVLEIATYVNPLCFGSDLGQRFYLEGATFNRIKMDFVPMLVMAIISLPLAVWLFRNCL